LEVGFDGKFFFLPGLLCILLKKWSFAMTENLTSVHVANDEQCCGTLSAAAHRPMVLLFSG